jgi:hypothetical protein
MRSDAAMARPGERTDGDAGTAKRHALAWSRDGWRILASRAPAPPAGPQPAFTPCAMPTRLATIGVPSLSGTLVPTVLSQSNLPGLELLHRGKVRDVHAFGAD